MSSWRSRPSGAFWTGLARPWAHFRKFQNVQPRGRALLSPREAGDDEAGGPHARSRRPCCVLGRESRVRGGRLRLPVLLPALQHRGGRRVHVQHEALPARHLAVPQKVPRLPPGRGAVGLVSQGVDCVLARTPADRSAPPSGSWHQLCGGCDRDAWSRLWPLAGQRAAPRRRLRAAPGSPAAVGSAVVSGWATAVRRGATSPSDVLSVLRGCAVPAASVRCRRFGAALRHLTT